MLSNSKCLCGCGQFTTIAKETRARTDTTKGQPNRYVKGHTTRRRIDDMYRESASGCWEWTGAVCADGYGRIRRDGKMSTAHRWFYVQFCGEIGDGLQVDHLCQNKSCVNPDHLEAVTPAVNTRRRPATKLTDNDVAVIRSEVNVSNTEMAKRMGVSQPAICNIRKGHRWNTA